MNKLMPNYGWVQNTSNLSTIRETIDLVPENGIRHNDLMNSIKVYREQADDLPARWNWDARCRIKAICATGLVKLDRNIQGYFPTELGLALQKCPKSDEYFKLKRILTNDEIEIFRKGIMTNPPVTRVLELLVSERRASNIGLSKYDIGAHLGFVGDIGFTHYEPEWIVANGSNFTDKEGDADKWARTIVRWLIQCGLAVNAEEGADIQGKSLTLYKATSLAENALRYDSRSIKKYVPSEMLCSNHHSFPTLVQKRRVLLLQSLLSGTKSVAALVSKLQENQLDVDERTIKFEIISLKQAGLRIASEGQLYKLEDKVELDINPSLLETIVEVESDIEKRIERLVTRYEATIPPRLVDNLMRYGYDGSYGREFESVVSQYFKFLGYKTTYLGQGHGRVTDVLARYIDEIIYAKSYGLIIDAKATSDRYAFTAGDVRKMKEYILTHGTELMSERIARHAFAFVSGEFIDNVKRPLEEVSSETCINGTAIRVEDMLELGNSIRQGDINISSLYNYYTNNDRFDINSIIQYSSQVAGGFNHGIVAETIRES